MASETKSIPPRKVSSIRSPEDKKSDYREEFRGNQHQNDPQYAIKFKSRVSAGSVVTATEKYLNAEAKVKEALMNLTGNNFSGD